VTAAQRGLPDGAPGGELAVVPVARLELAFEPRPWPFAEARRAEIDAYFAELRRQKPALWNGRVLLMHRFALSDGTFRGAYLETDYASFLAWRDWDFPDRLVWNCFGMGAVRASDGAFLLGVMGAHTANAGQTYFAAGTADPDDVVDGAVDLDGSVRRELAEETGLDAQRMDAEPGWHAVFAGPRIAMLKVLRAPETAATLRARVLHYLGAQTRPELADVRLVRSRADLDPSFPQHVIAFFDYVWRTESG
jgi:8-oxo-dGTP pyrophosphatase MutT (NUDIX family)